MDIGANLTDGMFAGVYFGTKKHESDLDSVIKRANNCGVSRLIITVGQINDLDDALEICERHQGVYFTVGQHPTRANYPLGPIFEASKRCANHPRLAYWGEMGLDYDRLHFAPKDIQIKCFERQLEEFGNSKKPLFLHSRNAHQDFVRLIYNISCPKIVHSFTGTAEEMLELLEMGCYIGFNGCSFKEEQYLYNVIHCPLDRILLESDCPWCEIKQTHAGFRYISDNKGKLTGIRSRYKIVRNDKFEVGCLVKARNEPCSIVDVAYVIASVKYISIEDVILMTTSTGERLLAEGGATL